jgi:hypothetical protein
MTKTYNYVVHGKDFSIITNNSVKKIKRKAGKISQSGIRTFGENAYILQSNSAHDILDVFRNGGWAHSSSAKIKNGMKVYILPSNKIEKTYGIAAQGCVFTATEDMYKDINNEFEWTSESR